VTTPYREVMSVMFYGDGRGGGGAWLALACVLMILVVLAAYTAWAVRNHRGQEPQALLAERFARGEIDADEFALRRDVLDRHQPTGAGR
jgi:uncharacterized membrane protein